MDFKEALKLYDLDLLELGVMANEIRSKKHQKKVFFNSNRHLNPTNECTDTCKFCAFSAHRKNPNPYTMDIESALKIAKEAQEEGAREIHIVGAHNPKCDIEWYSTLFKEIKKNCPSLHIKALTAAEVNYLANLAGVNFEKILEKMIESGVDSMPGGGAEIFAENVREKICKSKVSSKTWLEIHKHWHKLGKKSNATMLFGHIESREDRIDHIFRIRSAQQSGIENGNGGFNAFISLVFQIENNYLKIEKNISAQEILKTIAISRIVLDNVEHIKSYWATLGLNLALVAQEFGADDLDGTIVKESIQSAGGAKSAKGQDKDELIFKIKDAGFVPIERDSLYNEISSF